MDLMWMFPREERLGGVLFDYPSSIVALVLLYLWFVLLAGPRWMANREPLRLKTATRCFNLFQVVANIWYSYTTTSLAVRNYHTGRFSLGCNPPSIGLAPLADPWDNFLILIMCHVYFRVRILDFLDTVFFVLSKKQSHVSFLHVYHHVVVVVTAYVYLRSGWAPCIYYASLLNSMVHVVMYSYYFLSTFPSMRPYLWWKKYLTVVQISQFAILLLQIVYISIYNCGYPPIVCQYNIAQVCIFLVLFTNFYARSYGRQKRID
ncbi:elongation of very long chain fatty acids protein 5-like [Galendromus occidentalis]|uniref:Elongation of very long chain fatty acids protein n=1 Tax=Galendromus occidentalis TaxID=34638 RepID=A0AAJ6QLS0_9ACAR|nr:elongation of very long chain fatty acids protein 5-like [Galendromus occidentalis]